MTRNNSLFIPNKKYILFLCALSINFHIFTMNITINDQAVWDNIITIKNHAINKGFEDTFALPADNTKLPISLSIDKLGNIFKIYGDLNHIDILFFQDVPNVTLQSMERALYTIYGYMLKIEENNNPDEITSKRVIGTFLANALINLYQQKLSKLEQQLKYEKSNQLAENQKNFNKIKEKDERIDGLYTMLNVCGIVIFSLSISILYLLIYKK